ncbi:MaoC/PaaZ C-terminal domain-containing protein [Bacillus sp. 2205SS5-2]|uniref:MaoC/PaaZ C-terminal domain-containing protein n=1 Tax=Bacillus sp. 2205SS5-2 TaxID=3109031 RepID=UPI003006277F
MIFSQFFEGQRFQTEPSLITKEEILHFASQFDPQYFHLNEVEAAHGPFKGIIASGFHTMSIIWAKFIKMNILGTDCLGGTGAELIQWKKPVRPNDVIAGVITVKSKNPLSRNKGLLSLQMTIENAENQEVCSALVKVLVRDIQLKEEE